MKRLFVLAMIVALPLVLAAKGYKPGDKAVDFKLKNVDGSFVSMSNYSDVKGFIVVFTCNTCPVAQAYEQRIIDLDKEFKPKGMPVIAINPNDPEIKPGDSFEKMVELAKEKEYPFPYVFDETQEVFKEYGATKTPHVYLLKKEGKNYVVKYVGAIDNNQRDGSAATDHYVKDAVNSILADKNPDPSLTKAVGCSIKYKQ